MNVMQEGAVEVHHRATDKDSAAVATMRVQVAPFKGKLTGPEARASFDEVMEHTPDAPGVTYEQGVVGGVSGLWSRPEGARAGAVLLYLHGGAFVLGSTHAYRHFVGQIAGRAQVSAFAPDYRLAPEHPFPAATDDARAVYRGLVEQGAKRIAIVGDSAGGGLALVLTSVTQADAVARKGVAPTAAVAISPWTDLTLSGASFEMRADDDPLLTRDMLATTRAHYLGAHDPRDALASALFSATKGLPPIQLHAGTYEVLLDDTRRYAERASADGVDITAHIWEGMPHVFAANLGVLDAADESLNIIAAFLRDKLH